MCKASATPRWVVFREESFSHTLALLDEFAFAAADAAAASATAEEAGSEDGGSEEELLFLACGGGGRQSFPPEICLGESPQ